ncbi:MAG: DUF983 domain-containing protein [Acidimicrobiales bacterium]
MTSEEPEIVGRTPSWVRLLARGARLRCPACASGHLFRHWITMADTCPRCGLRFARIEGHWIGAIGINTIVSFSAFLLTTAVGLIATFPNFPVLPLILLNVAVAVIVPLVFYPFSRTLWTGLDIAMRPLEPHEVDWTRVKA